MKHTERYGYRPITRIREALKKRSPLLVRRQRWNELTFALAVEVLKNAGELVICHEPLRGADFITLRRVT